MLEIESIGMITNEAISSVKAVDGYPDFKIPMQYENFNLESQKEIKEIERKSEE